MKISIVFPVLPLLSALVFSSCQRSDNEAANKVDAQAEEDRAAVLAAADALESERAQVQLERAALEAEREELRLRREAAMAAKEQELAGFEADLAFENEEVMRTAEALAADQAELDLREQELNQVELEQAGTTLIADWTPSKPEVFQEPVADFSLFYDDLEPYGDWFETPDYGYVYQPTVVIQNRSWRPYTYGKWVCSNLGWTWRSDEPFGWATFHYGRWALLSGRGWCWVPGSEWAPSWCAWREGAGHVGWAPLPPETLAYRGRGWGSKVDVDLGIASSWFNFVENRHMASSLARYCLPVSRNRHFISATRGCTNIQFQQNCIIAGGPSYAALYRAVNQPWPVCHLDLDFVGGLGYGKARYDQRNGVRHGNRLKLFAPALEAPWNPSLSPGKVSDRWKSVEVVRAENGLEKTWSRRLAEARERQQESAQRWVRANGDLEVSREQQLNVNREKVAEAQTRNQESIERQASLRERRMVDARTAADEPATTGRNGGPTAGASSRIGSAGVTKARSASGRTLPPGVSRGEMKLPIDRTPDTSADLGRGEVNPPREVGPVGSPERAGASANDRLAELRKRQEGARQAAARRAEDAQAQTEEVRSKPPVASGGRSAAAASMKARLEQARQQRERQAQDLADRQAQQEQLLKQQAQAEQARQMEEQARQRADGERQAAERSAAEAAAELSAQQQEMARRQEMARQAAQKQARQKQDQARGRQVAQERARQVAIERARQAQEQEQARQAREQERARQAAMEQARQAQAKARQAQEQEQARRAQERARQADQERGRQQQQNQERIREAQKRMREQRQRGGN